MRTVLLTVLALSIATPVLAAGRGKPTLAHAMAHRAVDGAYVYGDGAEARQVPAPPARQWRS